MGGSPLPATLGRGGGAGPDGEASAGAGTRAGSRKRGGPAGLAVYPKGKTANARARVPARYRGAGARGQEEGVVWMPLSPAGGLSEGAPGKQAGRRGWWFTRG